MHITITGRLGSGKSTVAKILVEKHGYTYYSTGNIMRELAQEAGISILEYNRRCVGDPTEDRKIDDRTREVAIRMREQGENLIFDSRMAWFFAPDTFKVYVTVDMNDGNGENGGFYVYKTRVQKLINDMESFFANRDFDPSAKR